MGELGLFGLPFSEEYGGAGADFLSLCLAIEEISRADAGVGITLEAAVCLGAAPIHDFGTEDQKQQWLPDLLSGHKLWSFGLTEPEAGSDAGATKTRAELRNGSWIINGAKQFITNCGTDISAGVTLTAVTGKGNGGGPEISAILVATGTTGYHVQPSYRKLGWHSSDTHPLSFENCSVPEANLLGERGGGYRQFLYTLPAGASRSPRFRSGWRRRASTRHLHTRKTVRLSGCRFRSTRRSSSSSRTWRWRQSSRGPWSIARRPRITMAAAKPAMRFGCSPPSPSSTRLRRPSALRIRRSRSTVATAS